MTWAVTWTCFGSEKIFESVPDQELRSVVDLCNLWACSQSVFQYLERTSCPADWLQICNRFELYLELSIFFAVQIIIAITTWHWNNTFFLHWIEECRVGHTILKASYTDTYHFVVEDVIFFNQVDPRVIYLAKSHSNTNCNKLISTIWHNKDMAFSVYHVPPLTVCLFIIMTVYEVQN